MPLDTREIVRIAIEAGQAIMEIYESSEGIEVQTKNDESPLTQADIAAHDTIVRGLTSIDPLTPIVSEEGRVGNPMDSDASWLVDPLDGTKEFINRNGQFTVNIGIIEHGKPVMGVVYAPAINRLFVAEGPDKAWQADVNPGEPVPASDARMPLHIRRYPEPGLTAIASKSHRSPETDAFLKKFKVSEIISAGSSLKFCLLAAGGNFVLVQLFLFNKAASTKTRPKDPEADTARLIAA